MTFWQGSGAELYPNCVLTREHTWYTSGTAHDSSVCVWFVNEPWMNRPRNGHEPWISSMNRRYFVDACTVRGGIDGIKGDGDASWGDLSIRAGCKRFWVYPLMLPGAWLKRVWLTLSSLARSGGSPLRRSSDYSEKVSRRCQPWRQTVSAPVRVPSDRFPALQQVRASMTRLLKGKLFLDSYPPTTAGGPYMPDERSKACLLA